MAMALPPAVAAATFLQWPPHPISLYKLPNQHRITRWSCPTIVIATHTGITPIHPPKITGQIEDRRDYCYRNAEVIALYRDGQLDDALKVLDVMTQQKLPVFSETYICLLQACANTNSLTRGKKVHNHMLQNGTSLSVSLCAKLIYMYVKCDDLVNARQVFDNMRERDLSVWKAMVGVLAREGHNGEVLAFFGRMSMEGLQADANIITSVLPACGRLRNVEEGKKVHAFVVKIGLASNVFVGNCLVDMYVKCGVVEDARQVFDKMSERNVVSWNALITGYAKKEDANEALELFRMMKMGGTKPDVISWTAVISGFLKCGDGLKALDLFHHMQVAGEKSNAITIASVLQACASLEEAQHGKQIHAYTIKSGLVSVLIVGNPLIDMYVKCGSMKDAGLVFYRMPQRDVVSWNTIISGFSKNGHCEDVIKLLRKMQTTGIKPNAITWNAIIAGFSQSGHSHEALNYFHQMQMSGVKSDAVTWTALITGCVQNGHGDKALKLLNQMKQSSVRPDLVLWTAVIAGYAQNGQYNKALKSFREMQSSGIKPDSMCISNILPACARLAVLQQGREVHNYIIRNSLESDISVGNALIDMYAKCGSIDDARGLFNKMSQIDVVTCNTMIVGYALHGLGEDALALFSQIKHSDMEPDEITFTGVLSACCHAGLVDKAWQYFHLMEHDYHIKPNLQHYACMVDLLGRTGHLDDAHNLIVEMPLEPNACVLGSLLGACRIHCNVALGEEVARQLFELEPDNAANYVLLSNIYAVAGKWDDVAKVRRMMKERGIMKMPGFSWIEVKNKVHLFFAEDKSLCYNAKLR